MALTLTHKPHFKLAFPYREFKVRPNLSYTTYLSLTLLLLNMASKCKKTFKHVGEENTNS